MCSSPNPYDPGLNTGITELIGSHPSPSIGVAALGFLDGPWLSREGPWYGKRPAERHLCQHLRLHKMAVVLRACRSIKESSACFR
jgi:hypothetical protein